MNTAEDVKDKNPWTAEAENLTIVDGLICITRSTYYKDHFKKIDMISTIFVDPGKLVYFRVLKLKAEKA